MVTVYATLVETDKVAVLNPPAPPPPPPSYPPPAPPATTKYVTDVGAPAIGETLLLAALGTLVPIAFVAVTVNV
jgi:hypothetical protein